MVEEVKLRRKYLNSGDVFILDLGLHLIQVYTYIHTSNLCIHRIHTCTHRAHDVRIQNSAIFPRSLISWAARFFFFHCPILFERCR